MPQVSDRDVEAIKNWLAKEPHLPKTFRLQLSVTLATDIATALRRLNVLPEACAYIRYNYRRNPKNEDDLTIKKFLFSCHCSLERTKQCIDEFCTRRANMPEVYTNRDPLSKRIQSMFSITSVTTYKDGNKEILIHVLKEIPNDFDFYDCVKSFTLQADTWISLEMDVLPEDHIVVFDIKYYTLKIMTKINIFYFQKFISYLLEAMPVRLKQVHVINCPSFYEIMYNMIKPALPEYLCNLMHFHPDYTGLHKFLNKENLPKEYGGDSESMVDQNEFWIKKISENRKTFMDDNYYKADLSQKTKNGGVNNSMNGSFKTLEID